MCLEKGAKIHVAFSCLTCIVCIWPKLIALKKKEFANVFACKLEAFTAYMGKLFTTHRAQSRPLIVARRPSPGPKHHQAYMICKQSKKACSYSEEQIRGLFRECWRGWEWQQAPAASPVKVL